jgi:mercuric ion transport protein
MKNQNPTPSKRGIYTALSGTILVALCCFTPVLVILLSAIGLGTIMPYLDFVLLPALVGMMILSVISYKRWKSASAE